jgi:hypothetical protein
MSTDFVSREPISFNDIKSFSKDGIYVDSMHDDNSVILTDGTNYLWAMETPEIQYGKIDDNENSKNEPSTKNGILFTRYAGNYPERIIEVIESHFNTKLISEDSEEFEMCLSPSRE